MASLSTDAASPHRRLIYVRDLLRELVLRDLKLRYKRSALGIGWSLLNPLAQVLVFTFLFRVVVPLGIPDYHLFVFTGVLAWSWFQQSVVAATGAITDNRELIRQPGFPAAVLPAVTVASNLIHFLLALPILLAFLIADGRLPGSMIVLPLVIGLQFLLTLGVAYFVATFQVRFRDTQHLLNVVLLLLFYLTPVFYSPTAVPEPVRRFYGLNPLVHIIDAYRATLLRGELPDAVVLLVLTVLAGGLLWLGYSTFMRASYRFVEEL